jgi:hypothetical protein
MLKIFKTRNDILDTLPKGLVIAELGVFKGEFSQIIFDKCIPKELVLIDLWEGKNIMSGDVDGNNIQKFNGTTLHTSVIDKFSQNKNVIIHRGYTTKVLEQYPDNHFDLIYIDADHSYTGCKSDLEISYLKVKNGGYIMGHDYEQNFEKSKNLYNFGVNQAVNEFCKKYNLEISMKGNDGCVSYGIKLNK